MILLETVMFQSCWILAVIQDSRIGFSPLRLTCRTLWDSCLSKFLINSSDIRVSSLIKYIYSLILRRAIVLDEQFLVRTAAEECRWEQLVEEKSEFWEYAEGIVVWIWEWWYRIWEYNMKLEGLLSICIIFTIFESKSRVRWIWEYCTMQ